MSEVQMILEQLMVDRLTLNYKDAMPTAEQALYDLLMEKMPEEHPNTGYDSDILNQQEVGEVLGHNNAVEEMVSTINKLFGRTE